MKEPEDYTREYADKYDVSFNMISYATNPRADKRLRDMAKANASSRVIPFKNFVDNPEYLTGALYVVKSTKEVQTITETKIVGAKIENVLFEFNDAAIGEASYAELDELGGFLQKNPSAYAVLAGYTDIVGTADYNLGLSRRRAENVADYLTSKWNIEPDRIVLNWYGQANPIASNESAEGRRLNRRVEIAIGGL
jgi:outer membrane protein OmpA-like peptidoglycan-associated protein